MSSTAVRRVGAQLPRLESLPVGVVRSVGKDAEDFAALSGLVLDEWQSRVQHFLLAEDARGRWATQQAVLLVPRQNGKNALLESLELAALFLFEDARIIHTAHLAKTAADHMQRMVALIKANPELESLCQFFFANGKEAIVRRDTGARIEFITRGRKAVRGGSPSLVVIDEALYVTDEQMQAILPALSAQSLNVDGAPRIVYTSSAPLPESVVLHRLRAAFLAGQLPHGYFAEWSCEPGCDPLDRDGWYQSNPALGIRISEEWIERNELPVLSPEAFAMERLGVVFGADGGQSELPGWAECLDEGSVMVGKPAIAVDCDPDLQWTSVAVAGARQDGRLHVELVDRFTSTEDALQVLVKMWGKWRVPIHLDARAAAGALVPGLLSAKVQLVEVSTADLLKACAQVKQLVREGGLRHRGQVPLDVAAAQAAVRSVGEGWAWARRSSSVSISPLVAVTLAAWAARSGGPRADGWVGFV